MTRPTRTYTKRARAASERRTRDAITGATLALWTEVGPAATTISAVARRAGVQRLTVYRHFHDDAVLAAAAWSAFLEANPLPDPAEWAALEAPGRRLRRALRRVYSYYRGAGDVLASVLHDAPRVPALGPAVAGYTGWLDGVVATLEAGWVPRRRKRDAGLPVALLEHSVRLSTWRSLAAGGLDERAAARLVVRSMGGLAAKERSK